MKVEIGSLNEMKKALVEAMEEHHCEFKDQRNQDSIQTTLVRAISSSKELSGEQDYVKAIMKLGQALSADSGLAAAFELISKKLLDLFPVPFTAPEQNVSEAQEEINP